MPGPTRLAPLAFLAGLWLAASAAAQGMDAQYTLSFRGLTGGQIGMRATEQGGTYAVSSAARSTGFAGALAAYGYEGQAQGTIEGGRHVSTGYSEREEDGDEVTASVTRFRDGAPQEVTFTPPRDPRPWDIDPAGVVGVVDPLTGMYLVLRDVDPAGACDQSHEMFDGRHVSRITMGPAQAAADGTIRCVGEYRRIAGYSPRDMEKRAASPLTFLYGPAGGGRVRVTEVRAPTGFGEAVLRRR